MQSLVRKEANDLIDAVELALLDRFPKKECDVNHSFFEYLYVRECVLEAGMRVTSKIHRHRHPYVLMEGAAEVWIDRIGWKLIEGPYYGVTEAGTRRVLKIIKTCFWLTFHGHPLGDTKDLDEIEAYVIEPHENEFMCTIPSQQIENNGYKESIAEY
jgi:hypothetical protein